MDEIELKKYKNKLFVSDLIIDVLTDKKSVREALSLFPKDKDDINIKCAFDALLHKEADEDLRSKIRDYARIQDDYLYLIAKTLKENQNLPKNVIAKYLRYHKDDPISDDDGSFKSALKKIKRNISF